VSSEERVRWPHRGSVAQPSWTRRRCTRIESWPPDRGHSAIFPRPRKWTKSLGLSRIEVPGVAHLNHVCRVTRGFSDGPLPVGKEAQTGSATATAGMWKTSTKRSKSPRLPVTRTLPLPIASAGLSSPVSKG
jgi:hypothetical protein